jgi:Ca2+:H+ antiporter
MDSEKPTNGNGRYPRSSDVEQGGLHLRPNAHQPAQQSSFDESSSIDRPESFGDPPHPHRGIRVPDVQGVYRFWDRFRGKGRKRIGVVQSIKNIILCSWLNVFFLFLPLAWAAHFTRGFHSTGHSEVAIFALNFLALIPLEHLFEYGGEQMALYLGVDLGDLVIVTLNNAVEATLAIILLLKCELKLLQSTIVGVIILHLLLIPGTAFITGGAQVWHQHLHPHLSQLNHSLLTVGVLSLLLPAAFYASLARGSVAEIEASVLNDVNRGNFLHISRGLAIMLLIVYVLSRIYVHNPPGDDNALRPHPDAPEELKHKEKKLAEEDPEINSFVSVVMLMCAIALMAVTAEFLVESIEFARAPQGSIGEEWFGLILLPIVSFAADGAIAVGFFFAYLRTVFFGRPAPPNTLAKARAIDLSIQFALFWMPFIVLLGWWTNRPMSMLFDFYEIALLLAACFLVNYVTADAKTNWAEGVILVAFYIMIALTTWFYQGQPDMHDMSQCKSVAAFIAAAAGGEHGGEAGGHGAEGATGH